MKTLVEIKQALEQIQEHIENNGGEVNLDVLQIYEQTEGELLSKLSSYRHVIEEIEAEQTLLLKRAEQCKAEAARKEKKINWLKEVVSKTVGIWGERTKTGAKIDKVMPDGEHLYIRVMKNKPEVIITDSIVVPGKYRVERVSKSWDKIGIREDLIAGQEVPGVKLKDKFSVKLSK